VGKPSSCGALGNESAARHANQPTHIHEIQRVPDVCATQRSEDGKGLMGVQVRELPRVRHVACPDEMHRVVHSQRKHRRPCQSSEPVQRGRWMVHPRRHGCDSTDRELAHPRRVMWSEPPPSHTVTSRARLRAPPCLHVGPISLRVHCALCGYGRQPQHQGEVKLSAREWL
jgi:hypothetical protein